MAGRRARAATWAASVSLASPTRQCLLRSIALQSMRRTAVEAAVGVELLVVWQGHRQFEQGFEVHWRHCTGMMMFNMTAACQRPQQGARRAQRVIRAASAPCV